MPTKRRQRWRDHSHVGQGDVILKITGEIRLDEPLGLGEGLVSTPAEEGNAGEAEQRGNQRAVRHPSQTAHAAVIATCNPSAPHMQYGTFHHHVCSDLQLKMILLWRSFLPPPKKKYVFALTFKRAVATTFSNTHSGLVSSGLL